MTVDHRVPGTVALMYEGTKVFIMIFQVLTWYEDIYSERRVAHQVRRTRSGDTPCKIHEELRRLLAFSVPTFSSYNPDNAKNRLMPRIRLAAEDETPKSLDERRKDLYNLSISHL